jgi:hypothetical protein
MVSINTIVTGAILIGGLSAFLGLGGFKGIGSKIGQGFGDFGTSLISGLTGAFPQEAGIDGKSSVNEIVSQLDLENIVTGLPEEPRLATSKERGLLALAGHIQSEKLGGTINLRTGIFTNAVTQQPLGFTITPSGSVRTGTVGLGAGVIAQQAELSQKFGIPTFDVTGAISHFGGSGGGGHTGGSSGGGQTSGASTQSSAPSNASASHRKAFGN